MPRAPQPSPADRPIITLLSDFGLDDWYVAVMKAVLLRHCPAGRLVDVTHAIAPGDVLAGSIALERAIDAFPAETVHLAVVDPGVGSVRRMLVVEIAGQRVVCPDNGLVTWAWRRIDRACAHELTWRPGSHSSTFHGRDIMAPAAGMLAAGRAVAELARPIDDPVLLDVAPAATLDDARIIHRDRFGNLMTNVPASLVQARPKQVIAGGRAIGPVRQTYADVSPGQPVALIGSSGMLEIAVRDGSAADALGLKVGDTIRFV